MERKLKLVHKKIIKKSFSKFKVLMPGSVINLSIPTHTFVKIKYIDNKKHTYLKKPRFQFAIQ